MKGYFGFELLHQDLCTGEHHRYAQRGEVTKKGSEQITMQYDM